MTKTFLPSFVSFFALAAAVAQGQVAPTATANPPPAAIYHAGWIDLNKNGKKDIYEDSTAGVDQRLDDLLQQMTLEEKTCQLGTLYGFGRVLTDELPTAAWKTKLWKDGIGNIDEHLNSVARIPKAATKLSYPYSLHAKSINDVQRFFVEQTRLGIPVDFTNEGIRGLCHDRATSFPSQLGVASSWNRQLVTAIGRVTGREARALGYTNVYAPILDLPRDPRWGRTVECYSEDPYLTGELGRLMVSALQAEKVVSTVKHFAVYSIPKGARDGGHRTDPQATWREVESIHLPAFEAAIKGAQALGVMSSYNDYDGIPVTASSLFLTDILRKRWGFSGYVVSDSGAVEHIHRKHQIVADYEGAVEQAVEAGLNVRTQFNPPDVYVNAVRKLAKEGRLSNEVIDARVRDVLRVKFWLGLFDQPYVPDPAAADQLVRQPDHLATSLQAARESIVLLKNAGKLLPLKKTIKTILVTGPAADEKDTCISRYGPSNLQVVTLLEGIRQKVGPGVEVLHTRGCAFVENAYPQSELMHVEPDAAEAAEIEAARQLAAKADAIIVAVGENDMLVGEARSRVNLDLPGHQERLVRAMHATGKPTIAVVLSGRPLTINWVDRNIPAIVVGWFQGEQGGTALADVLFGDYCPAGKLPVTFPRSVGQIPLNFPYKRGSQLPDEELESEERKLVGALNGPLYPFGHGLSYTTFDYGDLQVSPPLQYADSPVEVSLEIANSGNVSGDEIVQLYVSQRVSSVVTFAQVLRGFERVSLAPGEKKRVRFTLKPDDLKLLDREGKWTVEPGLTDVLVGSSSADIRLRGKLEIRR